VILEAFVAGMTLAVVAAPAQVHVEVHCTDGCDLTEGDATVNLLMRRDPHQPLTLTWQAERRPAPAGDPLILYSGNPEVQAVLARRVLSKEKEIESPRGWAVSVDLTAAELGAGGTFLGVLTTRRGSDKDTADGFNETILDWRGFRLLTPTDLERRVRGPDAGSAWGITVTPALLQVDSGHGAFPRSGGDEKRPWLSFADLEGSHVRIDLDGEANGSPGLDIQVSTPWESGGNAPTPVDTIRGLWTGVEGHQVRFGDSLEWHENATRAVSFGDAKPVYLKTYYTLVTIHSIAKVRRLAIADVGSDVPWYGKLIGVRPDYFAHETSAKLRHPPHPFFWASYSRRELGADPRLLGMLRRAVESGQPPPGLPAQVQDDGDGGESHYTVGFLVQVRPWEEAEPAAKQKKFKAGLVAVDVLAARAGVGGAVTHGSAADAGLQKVWCKVVGCGREGGQAIDLDKPPEGYRVSAPSAQLETIPGNVALETSVPRTASRGFGDPDAKLRPDPILFPEKARFALSARMRAGALVQDERLDYARNVVPIDTYAQFIVRVTAAMVEDKVVAQRDRILVSPAVLGLHITMPPGIQSFWNWVASHMLGIGLVALLAVPLAVLLVPGGPALIATVAGAVTSAARLVLAAVRRGLDATRNLFG
jgi:hypothetical protein